MDQPTIVAPSWRNDRQSSAAAGRPFLETVSGWTGSYWRRRIHGSLAIHRIAHTAAGTASSQVPERPAPPTTKVTTGGATAPPIVPPTANVLIAFWEDPPAARAWLVADWWYAAMPMPATAKRVHVRA